MWISRKLAYESGSERAERGYVSMSSHGKIEAGSSVNSRNIESFSPYGYCANIPAGEEIILVPSNDGQVALGVRSAAQPIEAGEIKIVSAGGASIHLKNDGSVVINGSFVIDREGRHEDEL